jgi:hypothetical protein
MINEKNATFLMVGNVACGIGNGAAVDLAAMPVGSVVTTYAGNVAGGMLALVGGALVAGTEYTVINKLSDGSILRSRPFTSANVVSELHAAYAQPKEQVSFLGFDGTIINGLGTITLGNSYIVGLWLNHTKNMIDMKGEVKHISAYATDTLQATVVKNLLESHIKNFSPIREQNPSILCDRIVRTDTVAVIDATAVVYKVTKGSKNVTGHLLNQGAGPVIALTANAIGALTAGDVIAFPSYNGRSFTATIDQDLGAGAGSYYVIIGETTYRIADAGAAADNLTAIVAAINAGTQATASEAAAVLTITYNEGTIAAPPIIGHRVDNNAGVLTAVVVTHVATNDRLPVAYRVATTIAAANNFNLDVAWQGPTGFVRTAVSANAPAALIATTCGIATVNAANAWGLKFSGIAQPFKVQSDYNVKVDFDVLTDSFGAFGNEYKAILPSKGHGSWKEVAALEAYAQGNENWYRLSMDPANNFRREANAGKGVGYNISTVTFRDTYTPSTTGTTMTSTWQIVFAIRNGLATPYDGLDVVF